MQVEYKKPLRTPKHSTCRPGRFFVSERKEQSRFREGLTKNISASSYQLRFYANCK